MSFYVLIPARLESTRLKNKMLLDLEGLPLIVRTARQAQQSAAAQVWVATDSTQIADTVRQYGIQAVLTQDHPTGTDRLAEAAQLLQFKDQDIIVNVQGDEPLIDPALIDQVAAQLQNDAQASMATAAAPLADGPSLFNPNIVKVVCNTKQQALYFSRAPIPWARDAFDSYQEDTQQPAHRLTPVHARHHIGIYAYRHAFLQQFPVLPTGSLEQLESLEQLRALEHGHIISVYLCPEPPAGGVDTLDDLRRIRRYLQQPPTEN